MSDPDDLAVFRICAVLWKCMLMRLIGKRRVSMQNLLVEIDRHIFHSDKQIKRMVEKLFGGPEGYLREYSETFTIDSLDRVSIK